VRKIIGVIDEAASNRPIDREGTPRLRYRSYPVSGKRLGGFASRISSDSSVRWAKDFKYKEVQGNGLARNAFIRTISIPGISAYAFFTCQSGMAREIDRTKAAAELYGTTATIGSTT
jgi:hypothetical protein